ncbi:MAG: hypothetical protein ACJLS3_15370 [Erythrobacter sp.]
MLRPARLLAVIAVAVPALALTACNSGAPQPAGGVSKGEAEALAEAAEMLDETRTLPEDAVPAEALPQTAPGETAAQMAGDSEN